MTPLSGLLTCQGYTPPVALLVPEDSGYAKRLLTAISGWLYHCSCHLLPFKMPQAVSEFHLLSGGFCSKMSLQFGHTVTFPWGDIILKATLRLMVSFM